MIERVQAEYLPLAREYRLSIDAVHIGYISVEELKDAKKTAMAAVKLAYLREEL